MSVDGEVLFHLVGVAEDGVRVVAGEQYAPNAADLEARSWVRAYIEVQALPFVGTVEAVYTPDDLAEWRSVAHRLADLGSVTVGGGRGPEIRMVRDGRVIEVAIAPSGDDPWPLLRFLVFPEDG